MIDIWFIFCMVIPFLEVCVLCELSSLSPRHVSGYSPNLHRESQGQDWSDYQRQPPRRGEDYHGGEGKKM